MPAPHLDDPAPLRADFFLKLILWRLKNSHTAVRLPAIPCLCMAQTTSSNVKSGCFSISVSSHDAWSSSGDVLPPRGLGAQIPVSSKHFTHFTAALGLMSSNSAASRREAPLSTRAITRMRISAEYAFGMGSPQTNQWEAESPIYNALGILRFYSARTCSRCARSLRLNHDGGAEAIGSLSPSGRGMG